MYIGLPKQTPDDIVDTIIMVNMFNIHYIIIYIIKSRVRVLKL